MTQHLHIVPLRFWAFSLPTRADYYGYRWALQVGRWLIFVGHLNLRDIDPTNFRG